MDRLEAARKQLMFIQSPEYLQTLVGTIGADPLKPARCMAAQYVPGGDRLSWHEAATPGMAGDHVPRTTH